MPNDSIFIFLQVAHFSKYGLQDSDEEEEVPSKVDLKKAKTGLTPPATGLQPAPLAPQPLAGQQAQVGGRDGENVKKKILTGY